MAWVLVVEDASAAEVQARELFQAIEAKPLKDLDAHTSNWLAKRRKVVKKTISDKKRQEYQGLFAALDDDGGGEVEFEEFLMAWVLVVEDASAAEVQARELFQAIDQDGNGTMDFDEFVALMSDLEDGGGHKQNKKIGATGASLATTFAMAARSLRVQKAVSAFVQIGRGGGGGGGGSGSGAGGDGPSPDHPQQQSGGRRGSVIVMSRAIPVDRDVREQQELRKEEEEEERQRKTEASSSSQPSEGNLMMGGDEGAGPKGRRRGRRRSSVALCDDIDAILALSQQQRDEADAGG
eukprot:CAMPEP_0170163316 /NCGR_PEP_ID=MMETSP0033_2-20121228/77538_1 /TAXON_ID=195969 /ORGANISM="Dolichomastix tenuilepis, Strain CCMP3274" /LENGTH=293 /DNA_ID=CAMNT_0010400955 /DNA_START=294 /DNA_END=1172 /DNA_ORIENTATION=+